VFVGTFEHSLDEKGRLVLPSVFRHHLAERGFLSQWDECLGLWTPEGFAAVAERLTARVRAGEASQFAAADHRGRHALRLFSRREPGEERRRRAWEGSRRRPERRCVGRPTG